MFLVGILIAIVTFGFGIIFVWIGCIISAVVAAGNANKKMITGAGLNINTNFSGQQPPQPIQQKSPQIQQQPASETNEPPPVVETSNQSPAEPQKITRQRT